MNDTYNGWKNYATWNIALWISNDESLYKTAEQHTSYIDFVDFIKCFESATPDKVRYDDPTIDIDALDEMVKEIE